MVSYLNALLRSIVNSSLLRFDRLADDLMLLDAIFGEVALAVAAVNQTLRNHNFLVLLEAALRRFLHFHSAGWISRLGGTRRNRSGHTAGDHLWTQCRTDGG